MDVTTIASVATAQSNARLEQDVSLAVMKKALDAQSSTAVQLISALPAPSLPPNLGQNINTKA